MENLISQFTTFPNNHSLSDKTFDPSAIGDLMKLFEVEAYKSWAAMELETSKQVAHEEEEEEDCMTNETEDRYFESAGMESAMEEEFRRFKEEMERTLLTSHEQGDDDDDSLVSVAKEMMGKLMVKIASVAPKGYTEAALSSAATSVKSAWKGFSSARKLHLS